jgi:hypothetical protein
MEVTDEAIKHWISAYTVHHASLSDDERSADVMNFDIVIYQTEQEINRMEKRSIAPIAIKHAKRCTHEYRPWIAQIRRWLEQLNYELFQFQIDGIRKEIIVARAMRDYIVEHPQTVSQVTLFNDAWRKELARVPSYKRDRRHRKALFASAAHIIDAYFRRDLVIQIQGAIVLAAQTFDKDISYCPPSEFDQLIEEYVRETPALYARVNPTAALIIEGKTAEMAAQLGALNLAVTDNLGLRLGQPRTIVYISLVRFLFGVAYALKPDILTGDLEKHLEFLKYCDMFSRQSVRDLALSEPIAVLFTPGLPIATMFRSRQVAWLAPMEFMTNPIDLLYHIHVVLGNLAGYFGKGVKEQFLCFDDTLSLMLALMSLSPPANVLAIAAFLIQWEPIQVSNVLSLVMNYLIAGVEQMVAFGREREAKEQPP